MKILDILRHSTNIRNNLIQWRKLLLYFSPPPFLKKQRITFVKIFMEQSGNITIFNIFRALFRNISRNFIWNFLGIYSRECSTNISWTYIWFAWWGGLPWKGYTPLKLLLSLRFVSTNTKGFLVFDISDYQLEYFAQYTAWKFSEYGFFLYPSFLYLDWLRICTM